MVGDSVGRCLSPAFTCLHLSPTKPAFTAIIHLSSWMGVVVILYGRAAWGLNFVRNLDEFEAHPFGEFARAAERFEAHPSRGLSCVEVDHCCPVLLLPMCFLAELGSRQVVGSRLQLSACDSG